MSILKNMVNIDKLSTEMIAYQHNDWFAAALTKSMDKFRKLYLNATKNDSVRLANSMEHRAIADEIEDNFYKRFGFKIKFYVNSDWGSNACAYNFNIMNSPTIFLTENPDDVVEDIKIYVKNPDNEIDKLKAGRSSDGFSAFWKRTWSLWDHNYKLANKALRETGITIDRQKAYITGLPKDFFVLTSFNFYELVQKCGLTGEEMAAVFMHETGHMWQHIEYSFHTLTTIISLDDGIRETVKGKNDPKEVMTYILKKQGVNDSEVKKITSKNTNLALIETFRVAVTPSLSTATVNEDNADRFSLRFGMEGALASAMTKMYKEMDVITETPTYPLVEAFWNTLFFIILIAGFIMFPFLFLFWLIIQLLNFIFAPTHKELATAHSYSSPMWRMKKMKLEYIRIMRTNNLNKKEIEAMIRAIDNIEQVVELAKKSPHGNVDYVIDYFTRFWKTGDYKEIQKVDHYVEEIMENDLHLAYNKMKNVLNKG